MTSVLSPPVRARSGPGRRQRPAAAWWRVASEIGFWASLVVVVVLWTAHGGLLELTHGAGAATTSTGRLLGLGASDLLLVQVLLMARLPWVERSYGQDDLARRHRLVGFTSFNLVLAHIALITVGYAMTDGLELPAELWNLVWNYPGVLLATAGFMCLVLVVATSIRAARRALRYESWHLLHLYAYLGVGLALPHQLWVGGDFVPSAAARVYWWSAWAFTAAAVLVFRLGLPLWRTWRHQLVVKTVVSEAPGVVSVHMTGRHLDELPVRAGQFFLWRFLGTDGRSRAHPYSLSGSPRRGVLRVTVKDLGDGSAVLAGLRPGTRVALEGPYGRLTGDFRQRRKLTFLASGIGVTPLRALAEELDYAPGEAVLLYRHRSGDDALFGGELAHLERRRGLRVVHLTGSRIAGRRSWLPAGGARFTDAEALRRLVPDVVDSDVYVCGPDDWMEHACAAARSAGVPEAQLHLERFAW